MEPLSEIFMNLLTEKEAVVPTQGLLPWDIHAPQDVHEYFYWILDRVKTDLFDGTFLSSIKGCCTTRRREKFRDISVPAQGSLMDSLRLFFQKEVLAQHKCKHRKGEAQRLLRVTEWPNVLVISFKRTDVRGEKIPDWTTFPLVVQGGDLREFSERNNVPDYRLCSVIIHEGCAKTGHHYSYVLLEQGWAKFNDCAVTELNEFELNFKGVLPRDEVSREKCPQCLFYVRESVWNMEGMLTRILGKEASSLDTVTENKWMDDGYLTQFMSSQVDLAETGWLFHFSLEDIPKYTGPTLLFRGYPSPKLHPIRKDLLFRVKAKLWLLERPNFLYLFRVTENETEYLHKDMDMDMATGVVFCLNTTIDMEIGNGNTAKRLYFVKRHVRRPVCSNAFPRCLEVINYLLIKEEEFNSVKHFRVVGEDAVRIEKTSDTGTVLKELEKYDILLDGIYVVLANDYREYLYFKNWISKRIYLGGLLLERRVKVKNLQRVVQGALMSENLSIDWDRCKMVESQRDAEDPSEEATALSQPYLYRMKQEESIECIEKLCIKVDSTHELIFVGQGGENYSEIEHVHPVVIRKSANIRSLLRKLKYYSCLDTGCDVIFSKRNSFELLRLEKGSKAVTGGLLVLQEFKNGRYTKFVFTRNFKPEGYPFYIRTEGLNTLGDLRIKYSIWTLVVRKGRTLILMEDNDEIRDDEILLIEIE